MRQRSTALQGLTLGATAIVLWWLARNTAVSLEQHGISLGFGFLGQPANFQIGDTPIDYSPADTFGRAIVVGLANTVRVSVLGWVLSIALGFLVGVMRLARNPAVRGLARSFVEAVRNVPLLLLLLLLAAVMHAFPPARAALEPLPGVFISDRGLVAPSASLTIFSMVLAIAAGLAAIAWAFRGPRWRAAALVLAGAFAVSIIVAPPRWDVPRLQGFNFVGGFGISPELTALLAALVLHHAAHISEVVRGAVLAVPARQRDAAYALGFTRAQAMRFVVVPQALRAMVPLLASNCVSLTKNSSLAVAIGFPDLVSILNTTANQTGHAIETMAIMMGAYLTLSLAVGAAMNVYNRRVLRPGG